MIHKILREIFDIKISQDNLTNGLFGGDMGLELFKILYAEFHKIPIENHNNLEIIVEHEFKNRNTYLSNGQAGVNWFYSLLQSRGIIGDEDFDVIAFDKADLKIASIQEIKHGNWDMLHGALGIAFGLLAANEIDTDYFDEIFTQILILKHNNYTIFDYEANSLSKNEINLGLAHGLPSILKFCIECYRKGICTEKAKHISEDVLLRILSYKNPNNEVSYFPSKYTLNADDNYDVSRLAWCHGDLGMGYILYQYGAVYEDKETLKLALEMLIKSASRNMLTEDDIFDAGICHGSSGIAHIYNRIWHKTQNPIFKSATEYWIEKTIDFCKHDDGVAGYKMYYIPEDKYVNAIGLLNGTAGIGLVLLSYLTGDFSWDYCLMLND